LLEARVTTAPIVFCMVTLTETLTNSTLTETETLAVP